MPLSGKTRESNEFNLPSKEHGSQPTIRVLRRPAKMLYVFLNDTIGSNLYGEERNIPPLLSQLLAPRHANRLKAEGINEHQYPGAPHAVLVFGINNFL